MLKLIRIDDRLIHGQVAFTWTPALNINCIVVANDRAATDEFQKMTLGLAKPAGVKLVIKTIRETVPFLNDVKNSALSILVLIDSVKDAHALASGVAAIGSINLGGLRAKQGARAVSKAIALTDNDLALIRGLVEKGIELEVRQVPTDKKIGIESLLS
ncbi:MAG TPA: PTS sugar transporter subunit IIB [Puia sp.]|jgi:mannose/fructose/N-acetylgalactosamine-specific phosphotransferase system component IIB